MSAPGEERGSRNRRGKEDDERKWYSGRDRACQASADGKFGDWCDRQPHFGRKRPACCVRGFGPQARVSGSRACAARSDRSLGRGRCFSAEAICRDRSGGRHSRPLCSRPFGRGIRGEGKENEVACGARNAARGFGVCLLRRRRAEGTVGPERRWKSELM